MIKILTIIFLLISILFLILLIIIRNAIKFKKIFITIIALSIFILLSTSISLIKISNSQEKQIYTPNKETTISEFNIDTDSTQNNKNYIPNDEIKSIVYDMVSDEFGINFKYTKDFLVNSDGTYTISLLFDDTNYSKEQCKAFMLKLSSNLKEFKNVSRIEVYFLNNFKIKYSLIIDNFNEEKSSLIIKEDAF